jgi:hypothetical protein
MPSKGDRVVFEGVKVGGGRREGLLLEVSGRAVRVRWPDGSETLMFPGPGSMRVIEQTKAGSARPARAVAKKASVAKKTPVAKKPATKATARKKSR